MFSVVVGCVRTQKDINFVCRKAWIYGTEYRNLLVVIKRLQAKGYNFDESERLARNVFAEFTASPEGLSTEERVGQILTKEEWKRNVGSMAAEAVFQIISFTAALRLWYTVYRRGRFSPICANEK